MICYTFFIFMPIFFINFLSLKSILIDINNKKYKAYGIVPISENRRKMAKILG